MSSASSTSSSYQFSLLEYGKILIHQLRKLKSAKDWMSEAHINHTTDHHETSEDISKTVSDVVTKMLKELKDAPDSLVQESRDHVMDKMVETLRQFVEEDPANAKSYEQLVKEINNSKSRMKSHGAALPSRPANDTRSAHQHDKAAFSSFSSMNISVEDSSFDEEFEELSDEEKKCLLCFSLFPDDAEIHKKELINWWIGMNFIELERDGYRKQEHSGEVQPSGRVRGGQDVGGHTTQPPNQPNGGMIDGESILAKLVEKGFITSNRLKVYHTYRMCEDVHSKLTLKAKVHEIYCDKAHKLENVKKSTTDANNANKLATPSPAEVQALDKKEMLININKNTLDAKIYWDLLSKMKAVKVVHLGKWQQYDDKDYVVVKEIEEFNKALKNLGKVRFLSLRGTSGVVKLPDSVYRLKTLKVLDLRACHNLELLPDGIEQLNDLTHLDLSECYLLDGVPKGIANLTNLREFKGFIIEPFQESQDGNHKSTEKGSSYCAFSALLSLRELRKLSIRTRRMTFPTQDDLNTLSNMKQLRNLKIAWVGTFTSSHVARRLSLESMEKLKKLELQAAPNSTASLLLELISKAAIHLKKLNIIGGELKQLEKSTKFQEVCQVRLRYLRELDMSWVEFRDSFPELTCLEIYGCPKLSDFRCDNDGVWERSKASLPASRVPLDTYFSD